MVTPAIETIVKMLEYQPEEIQSQAAEHLQMWLAELEEQVRLEEFYQRTRTMDSQDAQEGVRSFMEKREPRFEGR